METINIGDIVYVGPLNKGAMLGYTYTTYPHLSYKKAIVEGFKPSYPNLPIARIKAINKEKVVYLNNNETI